jgi:hypothetical protein
MLTQADIDGGEGLTIIMGMMLAVAIVCLVYGFWPRKN